MRVTGLITEYNPFHNGHLYHLEESRRLTGADYIIALMSGNFVQRGAPAVFDKYLRTRMALSCGADLVLELPVSFSTASAREFAAFGVALLTALSVPGSVCFGSECGQIQPLDRIASLLAEEPEEFKVRLQALLKSGMTFPEARSRALGSILDPEEQKLLASPNNILGIEYLRAARVQGSPLLFHTLRRQGDYHDAKTPEEGDGVFASARAIRGILRAGGREDELAALLPPKLHEMIQGAVPVFSDDFSSMLNYRILMEGQGRLAGPVRDASVPDLSASELSASGRSGFGQIGFEQIGFGQIEFEQIADMTPELAARLRKLALPPCSFEGRIQALKTRQITHTRVSRALLHLLLNIPGEEIRGLGGSGYAPYARILGFRREAAPLLSELKKCSRIPLVTKLADARAHLSADALILLKREIGAAHLYQTVAAQKGGSFKNEYTQPIVIV